MALSREATRDERYSEVMRFLQLLKNGFGYVLLSMGVSRPTSKSETKPASKPAPGGKNAGAGG